MEGISLKLKGLAGLIIIGVLISATTITASAYPKSIITPVQTDYLGVGFNSIKESFIIDNTCLRFNNAETESANGVSNTTNYCFVDSKSELEEKFLNNFSTGLSRNIITKSRVTDHIVDNTTFSADKITLIAYWKQEDKKIYSSDLPIMSDEALSVLKTDSKKFFKLYGDKYVSSVTLGKIFFIVYQADISQYTSYSVRTKNAIKQAMELSLRKILGAKLTSREIAFINDKLSDVNITSNSFGNDIADFVGPYSNDDFKKIIKDLSDNQSSVIAYELRDYSQVNNRYDDDFYNISEYLTMAEEWNVHLSNLDYIISNSKVGLSLLSDCRSRIDSLNFQLNLVQSLDSEARFPSSKETSEINSLYNRYVTEMQVTPRTYYMPPIEGKLDIDLSSLTDVETISIYCVYDKGRTSFSRGLTIFLFIVDEDGNWSELKSVPVDKTKFTLSELKSSPLGKSKSVVIPLYEGNKFCDKFKIGFSNPRTNLSAMKIVVSFTEKVDDIIWLTLKNSADKNK